MDFLKELKNIMKDILTLVVISNTISGHNNSVVEDFMKSIEKELSSRNK